MAHRQAEGRRAVAATVGEYPGAKVTFGFTGHSHQVAVVEYGGQTRKVFFASTPSCRNAHLNAARQTRRVLSELSTAPKMETTHE
jgi:hypothetical protein